MSASGPANLRPIVAIIGTTGVGKSQLAVSLAQSLLSTSNAQSCSSSDAPSTYPAVVLSADSMQLYKGLDVITNKVTEEEKAGVEHWGLDMVTPGQGGSWEVGKWCSEADNKIASMPSSSLPIVCGGTHYFIQHFLFPPPELSLKRALPVKEKGKAISDASSMRWIPPGPRPPVPDHISPEMLSLLDTFWTSQPDWPVSGETAGDISSSKRMLAGPSTPPSSRPTLSDDEHLLALHQLLSVVDPKEGGRWHWRDGRKVRRGLERWWERGGSVEGTTGVDREHEAGAPGKGRRARFRTLIFWVYETLDDLKSRLDQRVDRMVENGLLREIAELRGIAQTIYGTTEATDHTEGIFQSIGYKEFSGLPLPQDTPQRDPAFAPALARTKLSTHQYAKSQIKWIKKQLLPAVKEARSLGGEVFVYVVNGGAKGIQPAIDVFKNFLDDEALPLAGEIGHADAHALLSILDDTSHTRVPDTADRQNINARKDCEACSVPGRPFSVSLKEWDAHAKSKIHKRNANPVKRNKDDWIALQRTRGEQKRAERERLKGGLAVMKLEEENL
ncbi:tRNA dimethylallyltransferase [Kwoniella heveanensis BCC8398]|uniref:tRNA dimethylallyltransferase n=1 Tax=Kwoniella heveanensis BCC8398 TaxID=1296120 RepID=A0A1B9GPS7_9TREE|nr:tRNA dimethylallyltransferase [Kwoniella heveanensis BCC8398]